MLVQAIRRCFCLLLVWPAHRSLPKAAADSALPARYLEPRAWMLARHKTLKFPGVKLLVQHERDEVTTADAM
jgi:hypothetical protein